jgi:hypothetical protein
MQPHLCAETTLSFCSSTCPSNAQTHRMHSQRKNFLRDPARPTGRHSPITSGKASCTNTCHDRIFAHSRSANLMRPLLGAFVWTLIQRASSAASCFFALRMLHSRNRERASTSNTRVAACSQLRPQHSLETTRSCGSRPVSLPMPCCIAEPVLGLLHRSFAFTRCPLMQTASCLHQENNACLLRCCCQRVSPSYAAIGLTAGSSRPFVLVLTCNVDDPRAWPQKTAAAAPHHTPIVPICSNCMRVAY